MMKPEQLHNLKVLVVGLGVTGLSVVRYLRSLGVAFSVVDENAKQNEDVSAVLGDTELHTQFDKTWFSSVDLIVLSPGIPRSHPALAYALAKGVRIIGDIELFASAIKKPVIAVTGSNGKSTVVSWIAHVLEQTELNAILCGNIGQPALDSISDDADLYVLELSSYQLESTESLKPFSASVLNISDDHMDRYASLEAYAAVKRRIYDDCEHAVANRDDYLTWPEKTGDMPCRYFSLESRFTEDYRCQDADSSVCVVLAGDEPLLEFSSAMLPGRHNKANALAVVALLAPFGIDKQQLQEGINSFTGLRHRTEFVAQIDQVTWYNDSKGTNIDACSKAIEAMPGPVVLIAGGLGKGADFRALRDVVEKYVKALVLIGRDKYLIADALQDLAQVHFCDSIADAVHVASKVSTLGDAVLMSPACASFDMFDNFEQRGDSFCQAVQELAA